MPCIAVGTLLYASVVIGMWFAPARLTTVQFYAFLMTIQVLITIGRTMTHRFLIPP